MRSLCWRPWGIDMELSEVRKNIDRVDGEIRKLFIQRMELADQVACIKAEAEDRIYKPEREGDIIRRQTEGMDPRLVREYTALIKRIMEVSRKYQYGRTMELRDCFPFEYGKEASPLNRPVMIKEELYACTQVSKDLVSTVDTWEEIASRIESGKADAGIGIIEEVGVGVSDELHNLLMNHGFYIFRCDLTSQGDLRRKVVCFGTGLNVLPDHNRIKILIECPNRSGSISSILSMIADYGVNLTEIHSIPFRQDNSWNYHFFAELHANLDVPEIRALIFQLSQETTRLQILGSYYCEEDS